MQEGWGIDKNGKPFYRELGRIITYPDTETVTLADGRKIEREIMREGREPYVDKTPEEKGWQKIVEFEDVVLLPISNPKKHGKMEKRLFHRIYEISVKDYYKFHTCNICEQNNLGSKYHYFRNMPSGIIPICLVLAAKFGRTSQGQVETIADREGTASPWCKLSKETLISRKEAKLILQRLQRKPNLDVSMYLGDFEVV